MGFFKRLLGGNKDSGPGNGDTPQPPAVEATELTGEEFDVLINNHGRPVVVDFWAEWCGPCHMLEPAVTQLAREYEGRASVARLDADAYPDILARYGIMGLPTVLYFKGGAEVDRVIGFTQYSVLKNKLDRALGA